MIDYVNKDLFGEDSVNKQWIITVSRNDENDEPVTLATFYNSDILDNSITLTETLSSSDGLIFGRCEASRFEFTVYYDQVPSPANYKTYKECDITVDLVLDYDTENPFRVGRYIVTDDRPTADRHHRKITAYDKLSLLSDIDVGEWYSSLTFPMTLKAFRDSFFEYLGFDQETTTLCNDDISINKAFEDGEEISAMQVLQAICEINGAFGHIGRDDVFHYVVLGEIIEGLFPAEDLYPSDDLYPRDEAIDTSFYRNQYNRVEYEDYRVKKMDGVIVMYDSGNIAGYTSEDLENPFKLENNFLTSGFNSTACTTVANNLYSVIGHCWYMVASVDCPSNLCVEVGDRIRVNTQEKIIYMYILYRSMNGLQLLQDRLESSGDEDRSKDLASVSKKLDRLRSRAKFDFEVNSARIEYLEADHVSVQQLTATNGRIDNLNASVVNIDGRLTAAQANITNLETTKLTATTAYADFMEVRNWVSAGYIKSDKIDTDSIWADYMRTKDIDVTGHGGIIKATQISVTHLGGPIQDLNLFGHTFTSANLKSQTVKNGSGTNVTINYISWS